MKSLFFAVSVLMSATQAGYHKEDFPEDARGHIELDIGEPDRNYVIKYNSQFLYDHHYDLTQMWYRSQ